MKAHIPESRHRTVVFEQTTCFQHDPALSSKQTVARPLRIRHRKLVKGSIRRELGTISFAGAKAPEIVCWYSRGQECQCCQYMPELCRINRGSVDRVANDCDSRQNKKNWRPGVSGTRYGSVFPPSFRRKGKIAAPARP